MLTGVITASLESASCFGKFDIDNCVFESDEAYLQKFADFFSADFLVVTNLFRDQLDRYGELATTKKFIQNRIDEICTCSFTVCTCYGYNFFFCLLNQIG